MYYHGYGMQTVSYEQIADQIITNAQNGHQESIDFLKSVVNDVKSTDMSPDFEPDNDDGLNIKKADDKYLKSKGIDSHKSKEEFMGRGSNSRYDLYINKKTGEIISKR